MRSILVAVTLLACVVVAEAQQPGVDKVAK
jgi:hypothetical protein